MNILLQDIHISKLLGDEGNYLRVEGDLIFKVFVIVKVTLLIFNKFDCFSHELLIFFIFYDWADILIKNIRIEDSDLNYIPKTDNYFLHGKFAKLFD